MSVDPLFSAPGIIACRISTLTYTETRNAFR